MPKKASPVPRNIRRTSEHSLRTKLRSLLSSEGLLRGTLSERFKTCGKAGCKCASGAKHAALYLVQSRNGKLRQTFVPAMWADFVKQLVCNHQVAQQLLDELSDMWWEKLESREF